MDNAITDVPGFRVGHAQDLKAATGCTVILCPPGTIGGVDIRGSAAGTRQIDSLHSFHFVDEVHAVLLSGGSAFGLDASGGVMKFLEEKSIGYQTSAAKVPIVPAAIIYDLSLGNSLARPDKEMGYQACLNNQPGKIAEGSVGVGTGASVGKLLGIKMATKGGVGTASLSLSGGIIVAAFVAVNAFGDVIDPQERKVLAGARDPDNPGRFIGSTAMIKKGFSLPKRETGFQNTTLGVVATNARLSKRQATKVAQMAQSGFIQTISPIHSTVDGDLIFALSAGDLSADVNTLGLLAEEVVATAVLRAIRAADGLGLLPAYRDLQKDLKTAQSL
ncbi:MAG: P1 family peptidase [Deltaproteobacteria bacterium]|nr:P1 family peptidase [Deltaproteobacteria bacterium]